MYRFCGLYDTWWVSCPCPERFYHSPLVHCWVCGTRWRPNEMAFATYAIMVTIHGVWISHCWGSRVDPGTVQDIQVWLSSPLITVLLAKPLWSSIILRGWSNLLLSCMAPRSVRTGGGTKIHSTHVHRRGWCPFLFESKLVVLLVF